MSEEYEEYEEGQELTAEEIFEQHQAEIAERFEEKGFFKRMGILFGGIGKPHNTREYKLAMTELQRLQAPILAILLPTLGVIVLIVLTAVSAKSRDTIQVEIARAQEAEDALEEETPEDEPEEIDMTQDIDVTVDVAVDVPNVTTEVAAQSPTPGGEPDTVMAAPSPVTMANIKGSPKMRGLGEGDGFGVQIKAGKVQDLNGALIGIIMDMKTAPDPANPKGRDLGYNGWGNFKERMKKCIQGNFKPAACSHIRTLPKRVALSSLFIPVCPAAKGPEAFGVGDLVEPKGWVAYYSGEITATEKARYRFWGYFDDYMLIRLNGNTVFEWNWPCNDLRYAGACTDWKPKDPETVKLIGKYKAAQHSTAMAPSDWWEVKPGQKLKIEIACSEVPGGACGGLLCIEKEGDKYEMNAGQPVFPIFSTRKLSFTETERFEKAKPSYGGFTYKIGTEKVPLFNSRKPTKESKAREKKNQVEVEVDI
ncbi:MAG: hypothetical protein J6P80_03015 [Kiritimatiellae bacterium]|nr:hypothetical protein [Kiritimatiellia bacterium]